MYLFSRLFTVLMCIDSVYITRSLSPLVTMVLENPPISFLPYRLRGLVSRLLATLHSTPYGGAEPAGRGGGGRWEV